MGKRWETSWLKSTERPKNQKGKRNSTRRRFSSDLGSLGPDGTDWWRAVQEVACGRKQYKPKQLVVPQGLRETILEHFHDSKLSGGHFAFQKTLDRARQRFWWQSMRKDIERKCENCTLCQARRTAGKKRIAPLQTINVGIRFSKVAADILGPVTRANASGEKYILVLTDYFTKYVVCVPLERTTAEDMLLE